jgi:hypothetical protein
MSEQGPIYGVELIDRLPLDGGMWQALPSRDDLEQTRKRNDRVAAGFEVLTEHYRRQQKEIGRLQKDLLEARKAARLLAQYGGRNLPGLLADEWPWIKDSSDGEGQ